MMQELAIEINKTEIILNNQRSLYIPDFSALIISDVHLGKTTHFRKHGIAVPTDVAHNDLKKLAKLLSHYQPDTLYIAGDFFHAKANAELDLFKYWKKEFDNIEFVLIKGNHDRLKLSIYQDLGIKICKIHTFDNGIEITHHPSKNPKNFQICGHIHPGIKIALKGRQFIKLPCFLTTEHQLILPAFSEFTGLDTKTIQNYQKAFGFTHEGIFEI